MKKSIFVVFILCLALCFCFNLYALDFVQDRQTNEVASDFTLEDLSGEVISLGNFKDKGVILFFWTTWCPHCREALSLFAKEYNNIKASNIELLAIDLGESKAIIKNFIKRYSVDFPILLDPDGIVADKYNVIGIPTIILVSKEGKIISTSYRFPYNYKEALSE